MPWGDSSLSRCAAAPPEEEPKRSGGYDMKGEHENMCKMMTTGLIGLAPRRKRAGLRVAMWETCQAWPSAAWLPKMAELLGCDIDALYERPAEESPTGSAGAPFRQGGQSGGSGDIVPRAEG